MISDPQGSPEVETTAMTERKISLGEVCEAWRREQRAGTSGHLPTSTLFDLTQQSLRSDEHREAVQHLAECPACLQDFNEMVRIKPGSSEAMWHPSWLNAIKPHVRRWPYDSPR